LDEMIRGYQTSNPGISVEKMMARKELLLQEFMVESDSFLYNFFKSDFDYALYAKTVVKLQEFLRQYLLAESYQCGAIIASTTNWERTFTSLMSEVDVLLAGYAKITAKVEDWSADQAKAVESTLLAAYQGVYSKVFSQKKMAFRTYAMQLISEAYYVANPSALPGTSPDREGNPDASSSDVPTSSPTT